jgi:hypothetical protein
LTHKPPDASIRWRYDEFPEPIWIVDAHRDDGRRFVVRSDEILSAFLELERITPELALLALLGDHSQ